MQLPLLGRVIGASGDFGAVRTHDNLKRWVEANGGKWTTSMTKETTHLIASKKHWRMQAAPVQEARRYKTTKIVCYDWLEDSLLRRSPCSETPYLWKRKDKASAKLRAARRASERKEKLKEAKNFIDGCNKAKSDLMSENHHIYQDQTGFDYDIVLTRIYRERNTNDRVIIRLDALRQLYETHSQPATYCTSIRSKDQHGTETKTLATPLGSSFDAAFASLRAAFQSHAGYGWEQRNDIRAVQQAQRAAQARAEWEARMAKVLDKAVTDEQARAIEVQHRLFVYTGNPRGYPQGRMEGDWVDLGGEG